MKSTYAHLLRTAILAGLAAIIGAGATSVSAQTIIEEWSTVKAPPAPELKPVTIDNKTTALLVIDMVKQTCNPQARPRCVASIPKVQKLLNDARAKGVTVVYSLGPTGNIPDILEALAPKSGEPIVKAGPDKFVNTELEKMLKDKGISSVIAVGTLAHGGVMHTATAAALRGFKVVAPVDGMSSISPYTEQYAAWHLATGPVFSANVTLTKIDLIRY
ncbi:MAG: cysteine hydrolase [Xanthobacteraceae bacterium]|nr:cysteine hydrolase [Xanthobacteraceae bacterium]